jgi:hypothetical protein
MWNDKPSDCMSTALELRQTVQEIKIKRTKGEGGRYFYNSQLWSICYIRLQLFYRKLESDAGNTRDVKNSWKVPWVIETV